MRNYILPIIILLVFLIPGCKDNTPTGSGIQPPAFIPSVVCDSPVWLPGGNLIGFNYRPHSDRRYASGDSTNPGQFNFLPDSAGFYLVSPDGSHLRRAFPYMLQTPTWSPDGKWIAFVGNAQIFKMKFTGTGFDTTTIQQLTNEGRNFLPAWSPDGKLIAFDSNDESQRGANFLWIMKTDGSEKRRIAYEPSSGEIRMPNWSSDGKKIVHIRYLAGVPGSQIFVVDSSGNNPVRLTYNSSMDSYPKYSPDGRNIAFVSGNNIWLMDTTGSNLRQLTYSGVDFSFGLPFSWSPDGKTIVYTAYNPNDLTHQNGTLWTLNLLTGEKRQLIFNTKLSK